MPKINLRESIDKLDRQTFCKNDLLNMYYCCDFNDRDKAILVEMFSKNNTKGVTRFIKEAYEKKYDGVQMICNPSPTDFNASMGEAVDDHIEVTDTTNKKSISVISYLSKNFIWRAIDEINKKLGIDAKKGVSYVDDDYNARSGQYEVTLFLHGYATYKTSIDEEDRKKVADKDYFFNKYGKDMIDYFVNKFSKSQKKFSGRRYSDKLPNGERIYYTKTADGERVYDDNSFEESYGGAFDIDENQYFTREYLDEFLDYTIEEIERNLDIKDIIEVYDADIDDNIISVTLSFEGYEEQYKTIVDMRRIRFPSDLVKRYADEFIEYFTDKFQEAIDNEDIVIRVPEGIDEEIKPWHQIDLEDTDDKVDEFEWEIQYVKTIPDADGFTTQYALYKKTDNTKWITMYGDIDYNPPEEMYADMEFDNEQEALDFFNDYDGFNNSINDEDDEL